MSEPSLSDIENRYLRAFLEARAREGALRIDLARELQGALVDFADELTGGLASLPLEGLHAAQTSVRIIRLAAMRYAKRIEEAIQEGRDLTFQDTLDIFKQALADIIESADEPADLLGDLRLPPLSMLHHYTALQASQQWQTLARDAAGEAAGEIDALMREALLKGVRPAELAARLRPYLLGAGDFAKYFHTIPTPRGDQVRLDRRFVPKELRGAAAQLDYKARRIGYTELYHAQAEADLQHYLADPLVIGMRLELAPDRGTQVMPDVCDILAEGDFFGMGAGVYPLTKVPAPAHPFCRCLRRPVMRTWAEKDDPKPDPAQLRSPATVIPSGARHMRGDALTRAHAAAEAAITWGELAGRGAVVS